MTFLQAVLSVGVAALAAALALTLLPRLGWAGRRVADWLCYAPAVDVMVALLTWVPWLAAGLAWGWAGVGGALVGQALALYAWIAVHGMMHRQAANGTRLVEVHHRLVGRWRNQLALALTVVGVPVLWVVRVTEIFAYPLLVWLLGFPRYRQSEWVNLSRHKVQDLVGHDLVWCLYCDWMTGVWSLGSEMLRNVESFWCPIRFAEPRKNEHARIDFPDVAGAWTSAEGTVAEAAALLERKYSTGLRSWFGHPERDEIAGEAWVDDLHREVLAEHSQQPRNRRAMCDSSHHAHGHTPVCNDQVDVYLNLENDRITDVSFTATACALCTASASLMTQRLQGCTIEEARRLYEAFHIAMLRPNDAREELGETAVLAGIHRFPSRIKCVTLPWHTMSAALNDHNDQKQQRAAATDMSG